MRLIDADALMEELKTPVLIDNEKASRIWEGWHECTISVKEVIDRMPTIEPERKKGKWNRLRSDTFHCNFCGTTFIVTQGENNMNFCPNCGCKMEGKDDG